MLVSFNLLANNLLGESRYGLNGTPTTVHSGVPTPWNRTTIPRRCALLCTPANAPFNPSNYSF